MQHTLDRVSAHMLDARINARFYQLMYGHPRRKQWHFQRLIQCKKDGQGVRIVMML